MKLKLVKRNRTNEPVTIDFEKYSHMLISAPTNSGKSYLIAYLLAIMQLHSTDAQICILDYKQGTDYWEWRDFDNVFLGDSVYDGFQKAYSVFEERRQNPTPDIPYSPFFIIFEEYQSTIESIEKKSDKESFLRLIGNWLRLSRQVNCHLICVCQRVDASLFPAGGRDNFACKVSIARLSPQAKQMLFPDDEVNCNKGQGEVNIQMDGQSVIEATTYTIQNINRANFLITELLKRGMP